MQVIKLFAGFLGVTNKNLYFYDFSAGGFASLLVSAYFKSATAIVNNPQTDMTKYDLGHVERILKLGFMGMTVEDYKSLSFQSVTFISL